jgi:hypothetical protein
VEWYRTGRLGLEQGFTVSKPAGSHWLELEVGVTGDVSAYRAGDDVLLTRIGRSRPVLRYGDLRAVDRTGRALPTRMRVRGTTVSLDVNATGARYPVRIDPFVQQGSTLTGGGESGNGLFGSGVALSADGNTALIGGSAENNFEGAAWVFTRSESAWSQEGAKLAPDDAVIGTGGLGFGSSVALSADGSTAVVGGPGDNSRTGAVWVFSRSGSTWSQQGPKLTPSDETGRAVVGLRVAVSADGHTLLAAGDLDNSPAGAVWVFTRSGSTWSQQGSKLTVPGVGLFGTSVSLSGDGDTALIGGVEEATNVGGVWVFTRSGSIWSQGQELTAPVHGGQRSSFGQNVALSSDASTAMVTELCYGRGAVWVFTRSGAAWTRHQELIDSDHEDCHFGGSIALSGDGTTALIGTRSASVWVYTHPNKGNTWAPAGSQVTVANPTDFGDQLALSSDGGTALMADEHANGNVGAVYPFTRTGAPCNYPTMVQQPGGLLGYWRLGESSGTTAMDATGQHNGTYTGGATLGAPGAILGDPDTSVSLDGSAGRIALPALGGSSDWTIQGWTDLTNTAALNQNGDNALYASPTGVRLIIRPSGFYFDDLSSGSPMGAKNGTTDPNVDRWVYWTLTRSGSALSLYRNGQLVATSSVGPEGPSLLDGAIGAQGSAYHLHGMVDEVAVSNAALGQTAAQALYACSGWAEPLKPSETLRGRS